MYLPMFNAISLSLILLGIGIVIGADIGRRPYETTLNNISHKILNGEEVKYEDCQL